MSLAPAQPQAGPARLTRPHGRWPRPDASLTIVVAALVCAVLEKLPGAAGTLVMIIEIKTAAAQRPH